MLRCALVWVLATVLTAATWWLVAPTVAALATTTTPRVTFDALLVQVCAAALLPSVAWLWLVTTVTVLEVVRGRPPREGGTARRWVLLACGVALAAGSATPALAQGSPTASEARAPSPDSGRSLIAGLALPDRAVGPPPRASLTDDEHVVRPGDSLWSIAQSRPARGSLDARWRAIWAANHEVIGDDPDLILPGQRLTLPSTDHDRTTR